MLDAVILSDLHLGSTNCEAKRICHFLEMLVDGDIGTRRLILNGDVFDSFDFRRLSKKHWKVLSLIRKLSDHLEIIWLCGNHDGSAEVVSHLLGVEVMDDYVLESGGRRILVLHGHIFDDFLDNHPILTWLGDCIYYFLQWLDPTHQLARSAKHSSKTFLRCAQKIQDGSVNLARRRDCDAVCCGHTHSSCASTEQAIHYFNSGCWTELPCTYLAVSAGQVRVEVFDAETVVAADTSLEPAVEEPALLEDAELVPVGARE
jgi:UDP-2,3-diacylglucosamine pyrophosphatase LpxH